MSYIEDERAIRLPLPLKVRLIAAVDGRMAVGYRGKLPWPRMTQDMAHFKALTIQQTVVMGHGTWADCGELSHRSNIVMSSRLEPANTTHVVHTVDQALRAACMNGNDLWVIGGLNVWRAFAAVATELHISRLPFTVQAADIWFPEDVWRQFPVVIDRVVNDNITFEVRRKA